MGLYGRRRTTYDIFEGTAEIQPLVLGDELEGYAGTKSSLHFPVDESLPKALVKKLIAARLADGRER